MILKLLLAVVLALGIGNVGQYVWGKWQARNYQKQIAELQAKNLEQEMVIKAKNAELADREATAKIKTRVIYVKENIDKSVEAGDDAALRRLFVERGMLKNRPANSPDGAGSDTGNSSPGAP